MIDSGTHKKGVLGLYEDFSSTLGFSSFPLDLQRVWMVRDLQFATSKSLFIFSLRNCRVVFVLDPELPPRGGTDLTSHDLVVPPQGDTNSLYGAPLAGVSRTPCHVSGNRDFGLPFLTLSRGLDLSPPSVSAWPELVGPGLSLTGMSGPDPRDLLTFWVLGAVAPTAWCGLSSTPLLTSERLPGRSNLQYLLTHITSTIERHATASWSHAILDTGSLLTLSINFLLKFPKISFNFHLSFQHLFLVCYSSRTIFHLVSLSFSFVRWFGDSAESAGEAVWGSKVGLSYSGRGFRINLFSEAIKRVDSDLRLPDPDEAAESTRHMEQQTRSINKNDNNERRTFSCVDYSSPWSKSAIFYLHQRNLFPLFTLGTISINLGKKYHCIHHATPTQSLISTMESETPFCPVDEVVLFSPPSFQKFTSAMSATETTTSGQPADSGAKETAQDTSDDQLNHVEIDSKPRDHLLQDDPKLCDVQGVSWTSGNDAQGDAEQPDHVHQVHEVPQVGNEVMIETSGTLPLHSCTHKSNQIMDNFVPRHDGKPGSSDLPSDDLPFSDDEAEVIQDLEKNNKQDEPGIIRDPENEGDLELL